MYAVIDRYNDKIITSAKINSAWFSMKAKASFFLNSTQFLTIKPTHSVPLHVSVQMHEKTIHNPSYIEEATKLRIRFGDTNYYSVATDACLVGVKSMIIDKIVLSGINAVAEYVFIYGTLDCNRLSKDLIFADTLMEGTVPIIITIRPETHNLPMGSGVRPMDIGLLIE